MSRWRSLGSWRKKPAWLPTLARSAWLLKVPSLWRLEIANVLKNAARRGRCTREHVDESLAPDDQAWGGTLTLARKEGLTLYDAAYLELAIRKRASLASFDRDLIAAARRRGVDVITAEAAP